MSRHERLGLSLVELLAVVAVLALISAVGIAHYAYRTQDALENACYVNQGEIEVQAQLWYRNNGTWPTADMSSFGADTNYFPDGKLPACPTGGTYTFNPTTGEVTCSHHP